MKTEDISQSTIRSFLLGDLDEATVDELDQLSIADQGFADRLSAEQYELIDDWVDERLEPTERVAFGAILARSPTLVEKVRIARSMAAAPRVAVVERTPAPGFFSTLFLRTPRLAYGLGGLAVLIGVMVVAALLLRKDQMSELSSVIPNASVTPAPAAVNVPESTDTTPNSNTEETLPRNAPRNDRSKPSPAPSRQIRPVIATLVLGPPTRGLGGIRSVAMRPETQFLQLTIQTESSSSGRFYVEVSDTSGKADWRSPVVRGRSGNGRTALSVRIPSVNLNAGMHGVRLFDAATKEMLDEHIVKIDR